MRQNKIEKDIRCPVDYGLDILSGKWSLRIISLLGHKGALRFKSIRDEIPLISDAALSAALKLLIEKDMVTREVFPEIPPRTVYALSEKGVSFIPVVHAICKWSGQHYREVSEAALVQCKNCTYYMPDDVSEED